MIKFVDLASRKLLRDRVAHLPIRLLGEDSSP
jgi:hypothetical protein